MFYVIEVKTNKIIYLSRFVRAARKHFNRLRGGMSFAVVNDKGQVL